MWYRIDESREYSSQYYIEQIDEAVEMMRDSMIDNGLYTEGNNKVLNWLKNKVLKICPSPDKIKDFFAKYGQKISKKMEGCKDETIKGAWNSMAKLAIAQKNLDDIQKNAPEEGEDEGENTDATQQDTQNQDTQNTDGENEEANDAQQAAESRWIPYDEGVVSAIKSGWNKLTGKKQPAKKTPAKKGKNPTKKNGGKKSSTKGKKMDKKQAQQASNGIGQFFKKNWKTIAYVLLAGVALMYFGLPALTWISAISGIKKSLAGLTNAAQTPQMAQYVS